MKNYIDIHCHVLPGIDDGAKTEKESLEMLRTAYREGTSALIATPHYHYRRGSAGSEEIRRMASHMELLARESGIEIRIYPGNELYYSHDLLTKVKNGDVLTLADSKYLLLEFSIDEERNRIRNAVYEFLNAGYLPIIAHIERCQAFHKEAFAEEIYDMGAYLQMNGDSLYGKNSLRMKVFCRKLMRNGLIHFVSSDAHDAKERPAGLAKTAEWIGKKMDVSDIEEYLYRNPQKILENERI